MRPQPVRRCGRGVAAGGPVYRRHRARDPASALRALSSRRAMQETGYARRRRAVRRPVHAGHGDARKLQGADGRWLYPEEDRERDGVGGESGRRGRPGDRGRVEAMSQVQAQHRRSWRASSPATVPTPRAGSSCRTTRRNATSSGPSRAWRAPTASCSACTAWQRRAQVLAFRPPAGFAPEALALRRATHRTIASGDAGAGRFRLQRGGRPPVRARRRHHRAGPRRRWGRRRLAHAGRPSRWRPAWSLR